MNPIEIRNKLSGTIAMIYHIHNTTIYYIDSDEFHSMSINDLNKDWEYLGMFNNKMEELT